MSTSRSRSSRRAKSCSGATARRIRARRVLPSALLAEGMAHSVYSPPLTRAQAEDVRGVFDFEDGTAVMHETIHYLDERAEHEDAWLDAWSRMPVPCSLLWGEKDEVAPVAVADYVWRNVLANGSRPAAPATYAICCRRRTTTSTSTTRTTWRHPLVARELQPRASGPGARGPTAPVAADRPCVRATGPGIG